jgi:hypothetical protein
MGTGIFHPRTKASGCMKLTTHLRLMPRLRMSGVVPLLLLYAFVV